MLRFSIPITKREFDDMHRLPMHAACGQASVRLVVRTTERAVPFEGLPDARRLGARSGKMAPDPQTGRGESCWAGPASQMRRD